MKSVCRTLFLSVISLAMAWSAQAQCLCADMRFRIVLPGLQYRNGQANYRIHAVTQEQTLRLNRFYPEQIKGDTVSFGFPTGPGIDSLVFAITAPGRRSGMRICVLHMHYDIDYFIDLTTFTPGYYLFDWQQIAACQQVHRGDTLIECNGSSFLQLKLANPEETYAPKSFVPHEIRPSPLRSFRVQ